MDLIQNLEAVKSVLSPSFRLSRYNMRFKASVITASTGQYQLLFLAQPIMHLGQRTARSTRNLSLIREMSIPPKAFEESKLTQVRQAICKPQLLLPRKHEDLDQIRPWRQQMPRSNLRGKFKDSRRTIYRTHMHRSLNTL